MTRELRKSKKQVKKIKRQLTEDEKLVLVKLIREGRGKEDINRDLVIFNYIDRI